MPINGVRILEEGVKYRININDCCAEGFFIGTFVKHREDGTGWIFDIGEIGPEWGSFGFEEIEDES